MTQRTPSHHYHMIIALSLQHMSLDSNATSIISL